MQNNNMDDTLLEFSPVEENTKETNTGISEVQNENITDMSSLMNENVNEVSVTPMSEVVNEVNITSINEANVTPAPLSNPVETITPIVQMTQPAQNALPQTNEVASPTINMINKETKVPKIETPVINNVNEIDVNKSEEPKPNSNSNTKYLALLPIFAFFSTLILGLYVFASNTKASEVNLIRIEKSNKIGYINADGEVIIPPKYISGTDYYKGRAIVKNESNMLGVLDNKNDFVSAFGNFFYIERFSNRYIASKFTQNGLKLALLNSDLEELTRYKYDNITYAKDNSFIFVRNNTMGILNSEGTEIYSYEASDIDDKKIEIEVSKITKDDEKSKYARIKVNDSSTIVNLQTGKEVYKYTLDNIYVLDNNVFYISSKYQDTNNRYLVIKNDRIAYQTNTYLRVRVDDYDSNVVIGINDDVTYDYIDLTTKKVINENETYDYTYGDGVILKKEHDFEVGKDYYEIIVKGKVTKKLDAIMPVNGEFKNGYLKVFAGDNKYNFIDINGNMLNEEKYDSATDFNKFGYSIVSKDGSYGVIDNKGEVVIPTKYNEISFIDSSLFKVLKEKYKKAVFIYSMDNQKGLLDQNGNTIVKAMYDDFKYITSKYPMIIGTTELDDVLINLASNQEYSITIKDEPVIFENYFIVGSKYYNYDGKKIYDSNQED